MKSLSALAAVAIPALLLASCSGDPSSSDGAQTSPTISASGTSSSTTESSYEEPWRDELVPVGGSKKLHTTCWGRGSPAVIVLHGLVMPYDDASVAHSPDLRERIATRTTYCEYERTNVGTSSTEKGPISLTESSADLNALLDGIGIHDPVVLLAGSHGGLLGTLFAGTYPDRLAGIVMGDPSIAAPPELPGCPDTNLDKYVPARYRLKPDSWKDNAERSDHFHGYALTARVLDRIPEVPAVLFSATQDNYPPGTRVKPFMRCLRAMQRNLAGRFQPGRMVVLDAGHDLAGYENRIVAAVLRIVRSR